MSLLLLFIVQYSMYKMVDRGAKSQETRTEETTLLNKGKSSTSDDSKRCKIKFPFCVWEGEIETRKCVSYARYLQALSPKYLQLLFQRSFSMCLRETTITLTWTVLLLYYSKILHRNVFNIHELKRIQSLMTISLTLQEKNQL